MSFIRTGALLSLGALPFAVHAYAQNDEDPWQFPDFSATEVLKTGGYDITEKVYRSGSDVRVDRTSAIAFLYVSATRKIYKLTGYPDGSHQCVVMRPDQNKTRPTPLELLNGVKVVRSAAGTEIVEGHNCKVETAQITRADGKALQAKVWEATDLKGAPIKIEVQLPEAKMTAIYRDIVLGAPDKARVTPPAKCTPYEKMWQVAEHQESK